jgi:hypothetical protein
VAALTGDSPSAARPGVVDLYRELWLAARAAATRYQLALVVELALIVLYVAIRTLDAPDTLLAGWTIGLGLIALIAPGSGLAVIVAVAPFTEWLLVDRDLGLKPLVMPVLAVGVAARVLLTRRRERPGLVVGLSLLLLVGTMLAVGRALQLNGGEFASEAFVRWLSGFGAGLIALLVAIWVGRQGNVRPLVIAVGAIVVAAALSLIDFVAVSSVRESPLGWLLRPTNDLVRLTGIIPAPNAVAALFGAGLAVLVAAVLFAVDRRRWILLVPAALLVVAIVLTYSRSGIVAFCVLAFTFAWRHGRRAGIAVTVALAIGLVVGVPAYLQWRAGAVGSGATIVAASVLTAADLERLGAWRSAVLMWLDQPLLGVGAEGFRVLHSLYGSERITAPHNELLRLLVEGGPILAAIGLAWGAAVIRRLWIGRDAIATGALGAFAALLVGAAYNNPFLYVQVVVVVLAIVGIGLGRPNPALPEADAQAVEGDAASLAA